MPSHLVNYIKAVESYNDGNFKIAKDLIVEAITELRNERLYKSHYYDVCFALRDENEILNELDFYKGFLEEYYQKQHWRYWLTYLVTRNFSEYLIFLQKLNHHYSNLIRNRKSSTLERQKNTINNLAGKLERKIQ